MAPEREWDSSSPSSAIESELSGTQACLESSAHCESGVRIETDALCQVMSNYETLGNLMVLLRVLGIKAEPRFRSKKFDVMHVHFGIRDAERKWYERLKKK